MRMRFQKKFVSRFFLRFHMSLILTTVASSAVLMSVMLYALGITRIIWRYPLVVLFSYGMFFGLVRVWFHYLIKHKRDRLDRGNSSHFDLPNVGVNTSGGSSEAGETVGQFVGQGGRSGGGGASTSWGPSTETVAPSLDSGAAVDSSGLVLDVVGGLEELVALLALTAFIAVIAGTSIYLIYDAPAILSEVAFEMLIAAGLIRRAKRLKSEGWKGSLFRATWKPLAFALLVSWIFGWFVSVKCSELTRLPDFKEVCLQ